MGNHLFLELGGYKIDSHWSGCWIYHDEMCGIGSESKNHL